MKRIVKYNNRTTSSDSNKNNSVAIKLRTKELFLVDL